MASISVDIDLDDFEDDEIIDECVSRCRYNKAFISALNNELVCAQNEEPLAVNDVTIDIYDTWMRNDKSDFYVLIDRICNDEERRRSRGMRFKTAA